MRIDALTRLFVARVVEDDELSNDPGRSVPEGRLLSDPTGPHATGTTDGAKTGRGFKRPDPVDILNTSGPRGTGPLSSGNGLYGRFATSMDDEGTLSTEGQYLALNLQYDVVSHVSAPSGDLGKTAGIAFVLGAIAVVAAIALAPETGGASLAVLAL